MRANNACVLCVCVCKCVNGRVFIEIVFGVEDFGAILKSLWTQ